MAQATHTHDHILSCLESQLPRFTAESAHVQSCISSACSKAPTSAPHDSRAHCRDRTVTGWRSCPTSAQAWGLPTHLARVVFSWSGRDLPWIGVNFCFFRFTLPNLGSLNDTDGAWSVSSSTCHDAPYDHTHSPNRRSITRRASASCIADCQE